MKHASAVVVVAAFALVSALGIGAWASHARGADAKHWVCPPCGQSCDDKVFDAPGTCPQCGMALVDQASIPAPHARSKVAILIFDGAQIIDFTGPYEMFQAAGFDVYTVAATKEPVTTVAGMTVVPKYTFADAPQPDVLVVPGGGVRGARESAATLRWVKDVTAKDQHTLSVCNGAFILASAGLLDGLEATTTAGNLERLRKEFPKVRVIEDRRWVDNGKIITAGGLTAGIDGALHVVAVMRGPGAAQQVALSEEHVWTPEAGFARATLADMQIPDVDLNGYGDWDVVRTQGDTDHWDIEIRGTSKRSATEIMDHIAGTFETQGKWSRVSATPASTGPLMRAWTFQGRDGKPWRANMKLESAARGGNYTATLALVRAG
jgi:putative intracellular protease/amidase